MRIIISNGSHRFHLSTVAAELHREGALDCLITGGWPSGWLGWFAKFFPRSPAWQRLLDRGEKEIPDNCVLAISEVEILIKLGEFFLSRSETLKQHSLVAACKWYAIRASKRVLKLRPDVYLYRNCYGLSSVQISQELGLPTVCYHSIAHPLIIDFLIENMGAFPDKELLTSMETRLSPLEKLMLEDLKHNDHLIVNSDFVKETCVYVGMDPSRIHVVYSGVDLKFQNALVAAELNSPKQHSLLFCGGWQLRKGVSTLTKALKQLTIPWNIEVAGGIGSEVEVDSEEMTFLSDQRVTYHGILPRSELAALMKRHRIFVFPSYCEGSARTVFEALAAGCFVITTPNTGSIVKDGIHGTVVPPGNPEALARAIEEAISSPEIVNDVGERNAELIRKHYTQQAYATNIHSILQGILAQKE